MIVNLFALQLRSNCSVCFNQFHFPSLTEAQVILHLIHVTDQVMREFDPEAVYIIGAFNDKATQKPISYARAMEQGIKCRRFPIDEYLM